MSEYTDRKEKFSKYLQDGHMRYITDVLGRPASQAEYATWLGISPNTLTRLINGQSLPTLENMIPIAQRLGPEVYDICGVPRLAYDDQEFRTLMDVWYAMSKAERVKLVENLMEKRREATGLITDNG